MRFFTGFFFHFSEDRLGKIGVEFMFVDVLWVWYLIGIGEHVTELTWCSLAVRSKGRKVSDQQN